jgi:glutathione synthase/RimK-type ligase-like ATP-grasp enzyme
MTRERGAVLLVTKSDDNASVDRVSRAIERRGFRALRLDTDRYPFAVDVTTRIDGDSQFDDVTAVWHRRFAAGLGLPEALGDLRAACVDESRRALLGAIASLDCVHVDTPSALRRCDHKELQLRLARTHGLVVPRTIITNDAKAARAFVDEIESERGGVGRQVVCKMQSSFAIVRERREHVVFTSAVSREDLANLDDELRFCPMIFQERIEAAFDVRATVVGDRVLSAALPRRDLDWRVDGAARVNEWHPWKLPKRVEAALLRSVRAMGLLYAGCDFVVDGDGEHWFLEMNAGGEWLWLDDMLGVADALAELLTNPLRKRRRRAIESP